MGRLRSTKEDVSSEFYRAISTASRAVGIARRPGGCLQASGIAVFAATPNTDKMDKA